MDAKLLATIIAIAKKEASANSVGISSTTNMAINDRIEVWIKNLTDTSDITVLSGGQFQVFER
tara:strand:- start:12054 stop:12242 length:189 start_codon:yes stop_codon:yes gene_type:complete